MDKWKHVVREDHDGIITHCIMRERDSEIKLKGFFDQEASAKLIASAPELLEMLDTLSDILQNEYELGRVGGIHIRGFLEETGRVIAKAKGKFNVQEEKS